MCVDEEFNLGHFEFNMQVSQPNGDVRRAAEQMNLDFIEEISAGNANFFSNQFKDAN